MIYFFDTLFFAVPAHTGGADLSISVTAAMIICVFVPAHTGGADLSLKDCSNR